MDSKLSPMIDSIRYVTESKDVDLESLIDMEKCPSKIIDDINREISSLDDSKLYKSEPFLEDDTISDELIAKNHVLQARWERMQQKLSQMNAANHKLKEILTEEKMRAATYKIKFQYLQENQPAFEKLKQVYKVLKYNEQQRNRKIVDLGEVGCQTKNDIQLEKSSTNVSEKSTHTDDYLLDHYIHKYALANKYECDLAPGFIPVKKDEFHGMRNTFGELKDLLVSQPLRAFVLSENKEAKYRKDIAELFMDNRNLKQLVIDQQLELDKLKEQVHQSKSPKEVNLLKKIIAKQTKHIKNCKVCKETPLKKSKTCLNDGETKIVDHIYAKYQLKLLQKSQPDSNSKQLETYSKVLETNSKSKSRTPSGTPYYTPRSGTANSYRSCEGAYSDTISFDSV